MKLRLVPSRFLFFIALGMLFTSGLAYAAAGGWYLHGGMTSMSGYFTSSEMNLDYSVGEPFVAHKAIGENLNLCSGLLCRPEIYPPLPYAANHLYLPLILKRPP